MRIHVVGTACTQYRQLRSETCSTVCRTWQYSASWFSSSLFFPLAHSTCLPSVCMQLTDEAPTCLPCVRMQLTDEAPTEDDEGEEGVPSYREWPLPCTEFAGQAEAGGQGAAPCSLQG